MHDLNESSTSKVMTVASKTTTPKRKKPKNPRTSGFSCKLKPETHDLLFSIADKMGEDVDRYITAAEVIEAALDALVEQRERPEA